MTGCWGVDEVEVEGTKTVNKVSQKGFPHPPQSQASSLPLFDQEGSAICDWFSELISKGKVSPRQESTKMFFFTSN